MIYIHIYNFNIHYLCFIYIYIIFYCLYINISSKTIELFIYCVYMYVHMWISTLCIFIKQSHIYIYMYIYIYIFKYHQYMNLCNIRMYFLQHISRSYGVSPSPSMLVTAQLRICSSCSFFWSWLFFAVGSLITSGYAAAGLVSLWFWAITH